MTDNVIDLLHNQSYVISLCLDHQYCVRVNNLKSIFFAIAMKWKHWQCLSCKLWYHSTETHNLWSQENKWEMFDSNQYLLSHIYVDRNHQHIGCTGTMSRNKHIPKCVEGLTGGLSSKWRVAREEGGHTHCGVWSVCVGMNAE